MKREREGKENWDSTHTPDRLRVEILNVQLVAKLQKIDDVASLLPIYLEGDALQLYLEMDEDKHQPD